MLNDTNRSVTGTYEGLHNSWVTQPKKTREALLSGQRLRKARERMGLSRDALGKIVKLGGSTIGNWEQGLRQLGPGEALKLSGALHVPAAYLMGVVDEDDMELLQAPKNMRQALLATLRAASGQPPPPSPPEDESPFPDALKRPDRRKAQNR